MRISARCTSGGQISVTFSESIREPGSRPAVAPVRQARGRYQDLLDYL